MTAMVLGKRPEVLPRSTMYCWGNEIGATWRRYPPSQVSAAGGLRGRLPWPR